MNEREVIAIMTDTLKSVREAIVYTFPPGELNKELFNRVTLAYSLGMDKLNEKGSNVTKQARDSKKAVR